MKQTFTFIRYNVRLKRIPHWNKFSSRTAVNLSYKIFGEDIDDVDPPILLFHGLLGNKRHWDSIGKTILNVTKRSVVAVDLRNHGDSPHVNSHKYEELAADILQLLKKLSIERATLVGHGMGGRAAMCVSLLAPEQVAGLLVVDVSPITTSKHLKVYLPMALASMKEINFKNINKISIAKKEAKKKLKTIASDDQLMFFVLSNIKKKTGGFGWACNIDVLIKQFKYIIKFPKSMQKKIYYGPTLFIGGQLSEYLPADDLTGIREMFPKAVITYVPQTGHNLQIDDPKTFLYLTITFIRTN